MDKPLSGAKRLDLTHRPHRYAVGERKGKPHSTAEAAPERHGRLRDMLFPFGLSLLYPRSG